MTHPAILDIAVVGLPDVVDGELPLAFIVLKQGQTATAEELIAYINGTHFSRFKTYRKLKENVI